MQYLAWIFVIQDCYLYFIRSERQSLNDFLQDSYRWSDKFLYFTFGQQKNAYRSLRHTSYNMSDRTDCKYKRTKTLNNSINNNAVSVFLPNVSLHDDTLLFSLFCVTAKIVQYNAVWKALLDCYKLIVTYYNERALIVDANRFKRAPNWQSFDN